MSNFEFEKTKQTNSTRHFHSFTILAGNPFCLLLFIESPYSLHYNARLLYNKSLWVYHSSPPLFPMDSPPLAAVSLVLLASFLLFFSFAQSSTIGVGYISKILEIQDRERALPSVQVAAARGVLQRLLPSHSSSFEFRIVSKVLRFLCSFRII